MGTTALRGQVYRIDFGETDGENVGNKYCVVVSNNVRNRQLDEVLACRITSTPKPQMASIVPLAHDDPFTGSVLCDDIVTLYADELTPERRESPLSPETMKRVSAGLKVALGLE